MLAVAHRSSPHHHQQIKSQSARRMQSVATISNVPAQNAPIPGLIRLPQSAATHKPSRRSRKRSDKNIKDIETSKSEPELPKVADAASASKGDATRSKSIERSPRKHRTRHRQLPAPLESSDHVEPSTKSNRSIPRRRGAQDGEKAELQLTVEQLFGMSSSDDDHHQSDDHENTGTARSAPLPGPAKGVHNAKDAAHGRSRGRKGGNKRQSSAAVQDSIAFGGLERSDDRAASAIPISRNHRTNNTRHQRSATTGQDDAKAFLSRSVPTGLSSMQSSALPDWDLPPPPKSAHDSPNPTDSEDTRAVSQSFNPGVLGQPRRLVPWIETLDEDERAAMPKASQLQEIAHKKRSIGGVRFPDNGVQSSKKHGERFDVSHSTPSTPVAPSSPTRRFANANPRPARHVRTTSVPSTAMGFKSLAPSTPERTTFGSSPFQISSASKASSAKFAGGRFQNAPPPTSLPMPSFDI